MEEGFIINEGILEAYTLRDAVVRVPDQVRVIGKGAFKGCASIEEIILPETITSIMDTAFKGCRKLRKINFPSELTYIGEYAFHRCHSLESIELPNSVKKLNSCAFLYCDSLEYVSMPGVIHLDRHVFSNDENLKTIKVSSNLDISSICDVFTGCGKVSRISLTDGNTFEIESVIDIIASHSDMHPVVKAIATDIYRMMEIDNGILTRFLINAREIGVPKGITGIGKSCFFDKKGVVSVKFPETLVNIESRAFRNCISLERIEFESEKVAISSDAFKNCTTLKYITLSDGKTYELKGLPDRDDDGMPEIVRRIHSQILNNFFISGTTLMKYRGSEEKVAIPEGITVIGEKAFAGNEAIGKVILPQSIKEIREEAFTDCLLLQTINLREGLEYIGESAFENCVKLIRADLPESLTIIEKSAFNRCRKLNEVFFGSGVKEIRNLAFYGCNSLKNVQLPEKLESIGDMAFYKCLSLTEIHLQKSLGKLGNNVFTASGIKSAEINCDLIECGTDIFSECNKLRKLTFGEGVKEVFDKFAFKCPSLKYVNLPTSIECIGRNAFEDSIYMKDKTQSAEISHIFMDGTNFSGDIIIPEGVTAIAGGAFYGNTQVTAITLPKSLKRIGLRSFCGCTSLKNVIIPSSITALEEGVFAYCTSLETVESYGKIKYIADNAFYGCSALGKIPLIEAAYIGQNAFSGCTNLYDMDVKCTNIQADAFKNTGFLENLKNRSHLAVVSNTVVDGKSCYKEVTIPEGVVNIAPYAFAGNENITSVVLPKSLVFIGEGAFGCCKNLKEVILPEALKYVGRKAFQKCISITRVSGKAEEILEGAFSYCINLKNVALEGVTFFGKEAFCGCAGLEICECKALRVIGDSCFEECEALRKLDFTEVKKIGVSAFSDCNSIRNISLKLETEISAHAFENCGNLEEIMVSHESFRYGSYAFAGCTALKVIGIGDNRYSVKNYSVIFERSLPDSVKAIYNNAMSCFNIDENLSLFGYLNKGRYIHIPKGIKTIEREVFKDAMNLEEIYIPESVEYIGERAFHGTMWLEKQGEVSPMVIVNNILIEAASCKGKVVITDYIKIVSGWAFANCFELEEVVFSSDKTVIEEYAFRNCINLKKVITPDGKEYNLTKITDRNDEMLPKSVRQIFMDCLNCFKTDENNALVECTGNINDLILIDGITEIHNEVFKDSNLLTYITLTKDVKAIGKNAFENCKWLRSVKNAYNVKRIEKFAFSSCYSLESIELSDKLEFIGMRAFENCSSLKSIVIPEGITEIPEKAFYRCKSLERIFLPSTLKTIGKEAFAFCYELTEINFPKKLEIIDSRAFAWCSKIDKKHISENVLISADAFNFGSF